jgi:hypothetical protein
MRDAPMTVSIASVPAEAALRQPDTAAVICDGRRIRRG